MNKEGKGWTLNIEQSFAIVAYCLTHDINVEIFLENLKSCLDEKIKNLIPNSFPLPKNKQSFFRKIISSCLKELIQGKNEFER